MTNNMNDTLRVLKEYWGYDSFRGIQEEIISSILSDRDTLGLMPTGGGKSICFQVPALIKPGVCLVITPLIALMQDQVDHLIKRGIRAAYIHSGMTHNEILVTMENAILGGTKILYVSPERLSSEFFIKKICHANISFITVDEAHCISQWGYDFRPSYLKIADIKKTLGYDVPILALTATATEKVINDIQDKLKFRERNVYRMSFRRENLAYVVRIANDKRAEMLHILNNTNGSAIVYTRSRARTKEICDFLNDEGFTATYYHAGLETTTKQERQEKWQDNVFRVMVATNAFGMGIDKPDVRLVIHFDCPDSIEAYFQEAGRAGRDGMKSYAVLLYNDYDKAKLQKRIADTFPEKDYVRKVYEDISYYYQLGYLSEPIHSFPFDIDDFCRNFKHFPIRVNSSLKILQRAGYIEYNEDNDTKARIKIIVERSELDRINNLPKELHDLIEIMLRTYGSMFTDYVFVDEGFIAKKTGRNINDIYMMFKSLRQRNIISFIPRQKLPTIFFSRYREDPERLEIGREVYEERLEQFSQRINAMIQYATNSYVCRSRQLLLYFGEESKTSSDCRKCDVCTNNTPLTAEELKEANDKIMELLKDGKIHSFEELRNIKVSEKALHKALENLASEEIIHLRSQGVVYEP